MKNIIIIIYQVSSIFNLHHITTQSIHDWHNQYLINSWSFTGAHDHHEPSHTPETQHVRSSHSHLYFMLPWWPRASFMWAWPNRASLMEGSALIFAWQVEALLVFSTSRRSFGGCSLTMPPPLPPPPPTLQAMDTCIVTPFKCTSEYKHQQVISWQLTVSTAKVAGLHGDNRERSHEWDTNFRSTHTL